MWHFGTEAKRTYNPKSVRRWWWRPKINFSLQQVEPLKSLFSHVSAPFSAIILDNVSSHLHRCICVSFWRVIPLNSEKLARETWSGYHIFVCWVWEKTFPTWACRLGVTTRLTWWPPPPPPPVLLCNFRLHGSIVSSTAVSEHWGERICRGCLLHIFWALLWFLWGSWTLQVAPAFAHACVKGFLSDNE